MPALFIVLGIAVVVFIAAAGHQKHPAHHRSQTLAEPLVELDRGMPPSIVRQVLTALGQENDPAQLDALGTSLGAHYPLAASELHAKATTLRGGVAAAPLPLPTSTPPALPATTRQPEGLPVGEQPATIVADTPRQLDAAAVLQAAMRALVEETDPVVLDGFGDSIRGPYPAAADILSTRAQTLRISAAVVAEAQHPTGVAPPSAPPILSPSPSPEVES